MREKGYSPRGRFKSKSNGPWGLVKKGVENWKEGGSRLE